MTVYQIENRLKELSSCLNWAHRRLSYAESKVEQFEYSNSDYWHLKVHQLQREISAIEAEYSKFSRLHYAEEMMSGEPTDEGDYSWL